ncbi:MAG: hypothetical protein ACKVVT_05220 [Dehalococcoidia bacterium]
MSTEPTIICVWCNRVMEWGQRGINYAVCDPCEPSAVNAISLNEVDARGQVLAFRPREPRIAALG